MEQTANGGHFYLDSSTSYSQGNDNQLGQSICAQLRTMHQKCSTSCGRLGKYTFDHQRPRKLQLKGGGFTPRVPKCTQSIGIAPGGEV